MISGVRSFDKALHQPKHELTFLEASILSMLLARHCKWMVQQALTVLQRELAKVSFIFGITMKTL
jgi:hypothetical protein